MASERRHGRSERYNHPNPNTERWPQHGKGMVVASIFREKNLERVSNPDTLDDYIRIASPGVWMVLVVIILLIAAALVWGLLGTVNVDSQGVLVVERGSTTLWLGESDAEQVMPGSKLESAGESGMVTGAAGAPEAVSEVVAKLATDGQVDLSRQGQWVCPLAAAINLPAGTYPATVTLHTYTPLELIFGAGQQASGGQSS